jgi:hypothetical protein
MKAKKVFGFIALLVILVVVAFAFQMESGPSPEELKMKAHQAMDETDATFKQMIANKDPSLKSNPKARQSTRKVERR